MPPAPLRISLVLSALVSITRAIALFAVNKAVATRLGPSGIAVMSQIQYALSTAQAIGGKSLQNGMIRYTKDSQTDQPSAHLGAAIWISLSGAILSSAVLYGFDLLIPPGMSSQQIPGWAYAIVPLSILSSSATTLWLAFRQGQKRYIPWFLLSMGGLIVQTAVQISFLYIGNTKGLIAALILFPILQCALCFMDRKPIPILAHIPRTTWSALSDLKPFIFAGIVSVGLTPLVQITLLAQVVATFGLTEAGLWQGNLRISDIALGLITTTLAAWYLPAINHAESKRSAAKILASILGLGLLLSAAGILSAYFFGNTMLSIIFDSTFSEASTYLVLQATLFGLQFLSWSLGSFLIIKGNANEFVVLEIVSQVICLSVSWFLLPTMGVLGIYAAFIGESLLYCTYLCIRFFPYFRTLLLKERLPHKNG